MSEEGEPERDIIARKGVRPAGRCLVRLLTGAPVNGNGLGHWGRFSILKQDNSQLSLGLVSLI